MQLPPASHRNLLRRGHQRLQLLWPGCTLLSTRVRESALLLELFCMCSDQGKPCLSAFSCSGTLWSSSRSSRMGTGLSRAVCSSACLCAVHYHCSVTPQRCVWWQRSGHDSATPTYALVGAMARESTAEGACAGGAPVLMKKHAGFVLCSEVVTVENAPYQHVDLEP